MTNCLKLIFRVEKNCEGEASFAIPDLSEEERQKIKEMSKSFWRDNDQILKESTGDSEQDRYIGFLRLYEYIRSWEGAYTKFFSKTEVQEGFLKYNYWTSYGTCYDGGCYSDEITPYYLCIKRIPVDELETEFRKSWVPGNSRKERILKQFSYRGELLGCDCTAFYTNSGIWLKQPFGLMDGIIIYK